MLTTKQKYIAITAILILISCSMAHSATLNLQVKTDKFAYSPGDTVLWTIYAWASTGDNRGIALLSVDLDDDTNDLLNLPFTEAGQFTDSAYGNDEKFEIMGNEDGGTTSSEPPDLRDITVMQMPLDKVLDIGNDGSTDHILATGSYTVSVIGTHALNVIFKGANCWPDSINYPVAFDLVIENPAIFQVVLSADVNADNYVDFLDYAIISQNWPQTNCAATSDCNATDLNRDGTVNLPDIAIFASQWLSCTDPANTFCDQFWK